jgi:hypothetical protein
MQLVVVVVHVDEPGDDVTVYDVIAEPPELSGADHETTTDESPNSPTTPVGRPGCVAGITAPVGSEASDTATTLLATTLKM